jgi:hypothetical protein
MCIAKVEYMKNITLALDDETLEAGRTYASRHDTTLNALVRQLLVRAVVADRQAAVAEMFRLMDAHPGNSEGRLWTREELYAR